MKRETNWHHILYSNTDVKTRWQYFHHIRDWNSLIDFLPRKSYLWFFLPDCFRGLELCQALFSVPFISLSLPARLRLRAWLMLLLESRSAGAQIRGQKKELWEAAWSLQMASREPRVWQHHPRLIAVSSEKSCTLAIIKPDAVVHGKTDEIIMKVRERTLTLNCPHVFSGGKTGAGDHAAVS